MYCLESVLFSRGGGGNDGDGNGGVGGVGDVGNCECLICHRCPYSYMWVWDALFLVVL